MGDSVGGVTGGGGKGLLTAFTLAAGVTEVFVAVFAMPLPSAVVAGEVGILPPLG